MHTGWKRNTTDSWASKYNNFRETKMNPENVVFCVLKTQVNWTLVRCLLVRNSKIRIQIKAYKRKKSVSNISLPCRENGFRYSSAERKITGLIFRIFPCDLVARQTIISIRQANVMPVTDTAQASERKKRNEDAFQATDVLLVRQL